MKVANKLERGVDYKDSRYSVKVANKLERGMDYKDSRYFVKVENKLERGTGQRSKKGKKENRPSDPSSCNQKHHTPEKQLRWTETILHNHSRGACHQLQYSTTLQSHPRH